MPEPQERLCAGLLSRETLKSLSAQFTCTSRRNLTTHSTGLAVSAALIVEVDSQPAIRL
jgi:hypothetical protein